MFLEGILYVHFASIHEIVYMSVKSILTQEEYTHE